MKITIFTNRDVIREFNILNLIFYKFLFLNILSNVLFVKECPQRRRACRLCKEVGHLAKNCPERNSVDAKQRSQSERVSSLLYTFFFLICASLVAAFLMIAVKPETEIIRTYHQVIMIQYLIKVELF